MTNPLHVMEGDSLQLITSPIKRLHLTVLQVQRIIPLFYDLFANLQQSHPSNGLYLNPCSITPSFPLHRYTFYACIAVDKIQQISAETIKDTTTTLMLKPINPKEDVIVIEAKNHTLPWDTKPHLLAIALEVVKQVLSNYFHQVRPWMKGIIPLRMNYDLPLETEDRIIDSLVRDGLGSILEEVDHFPGRLISVTLTPVGLAINILCNVREYLWTRDQEMRL